MEYIRRATPEDEVARLEGYKAMLLEHGKNDFYGDYVGLAVEKYFIKFDTTGEQII